MICTGLTKYRDGGLLLLRIGIGLAFMMHGWPKVKGGPAAWTQIGGAMGILGIHFLPGFWGFMAAMAEFLGGLLFAVGFVFRPVCVVLTFQMLMALLFHLNRGDSFVQFSHALEAMIVFLSMILIGPGKYSGDELLSRR